MNWARTTEPTGPRDRTEHHILMHTPAPVFEHGNSRSKRTATTKKLREEVGSIKLCQKPRWGQKGRERSPTSAATSTAGAEGLRLGAHTEMY